MIGVSLDSQETSERFRESLDLPYPLVGDPKGTILRAYGARWPIIGLAQRVTYIINRDKTIRVAHHRELDIDSHIKRVCGEPSIAASYHEGASFAPPEE